MHRIQAREGADPMTMDRRAFSSKRKLPGEADKYMNDFYLNSTDAIMQYIPAAVRSTEYNKRFGRDLVQKKKRRCKRQPSRLCRLLARGSCKCWHEAA